MEPALAVFTLVISIYVFTDLRTLCIKRGVFYIYHTDIKCVVFVVVVVVVGGGGGGVCVCVCA